MADEQIRLASAEEGYDRQDPEGIPVFAFAGVIVVTLIASFIFVTYYYDTVRDNQVQAAVGDVGARELTEVHASEDQTLSRYKYIDKATGKVNLPVERAMELFEQEAKAGNLFYPTKPMPVKTAADLAAAGGAPVDGAAPAPGAPATATPAPGAPVPPVPTTPGEHGKK